MLMPAVVDVNHRNEMIDMNNKTKILGAVLCIGLVVTGGMVWLLVNRPKSNYEIEEKTFVVDVFHWGFVTSSSSDMQIASNSLNEYGLPTTTLKVNENDRVTVIFRNAEIVPALKEKYQLYMDRAFAAMNLTPVEWSFIKDKTPFFRGYLITLDCYCGVVAMNETTYSASLTFNAGFSGEIGFRAINALKMIPMSGNILVM